MSFNQLATVLPCQEMTLLELPAYTITCFLSLYKSCACVTFQELYNSVQLYMGTLALLIELDLCLKKSPAVLFFSAIHLLFCFFFLIYYLMFPYYSCGTANSRLYRFVTLLNVININYITHKASSV